MYRKPSAPPEMLTTLSFQWPYNPYGYSFGTDTDMATDVDCNLVPTSRLPLRAHTGWTAEGAGGFYPPAHNYWVDLPDGWEMWTIPAVEVDYYPNMIGPGVGARYSWYLDGAAYFENRFSPIQMTYIVLWQENRWLNTDVAYGRCYCMGGRFAELEDLPTPPPERNVVTLADGSRELRIGRRRIRVPSADRIPGRRR